METVAPFAEAIEEIKKAGADSVRLCFQCGKCDVVCPWNRVRDFSIRRIVREANFGLPEIELDARRLVFDRQLAQSGDVRCDRGDQRFELVAQCRETRLGARQVDRPR